MDTVTDPSIPGDSSSAPFTVPTVDLAGFGSNPLRSQEIAAAVDDACRSVGFLQVTGHGIPAETIAAALASSDAFFTQPEAVKRKYVSPKPSVNRGYAPLGSESLSYSLGVERPPDLFEAFNLGPDDVDDADPVRAARSETWFVANIWPDETPELRTGLTNYFAEARRVADTMTEVFALALGMPAGWFSTFTGHSTDTMRSIRYVRAPGSPPTADGQKRMGEHTDYGMVTVLYADPVPGLQLLDATGRWRDVVPAEGALVINIGDLMAQWTNDRWRSTLHRVIPPPVADDGPSLRRSMAFFLDGNYDSVIECLPTCLVGGEAPKYAPVRAEDHLMAKLLGPRTSVPSAAADTVGRRLVSVDPTAAATFGG